MPPVALLACSFAAGIALREATSLPLSIAAATAIVGLAILVLAWRRRWRIGAASLAQAAALGLLAAAAAWPRPQEGLLDGKPWDVVGRIEGLPERGFGRTRLLVDLVEVSRGEGDRRTARSARGRVQVSLDGEPAEPLSPGDRVRFRARLVPPHGFHEPESPDPERRFADRGVIAVAGVAEPSALVRLADGSPEGGLLRSVATLRRWLLARVAASLAGERRALVESLVLGERGGVSRELDEAFRRAGVSHVLSVSGLHLAAAAFLLLVVARRLLLRSSWLARRVVIGRIAAALAIPATGFYTLLTGAAVATVRSCMVTWLWLAGAALLRPPRAATGLGLSALLLLGASPLALYDPSLQLSFAAALGLALLAPPAMRFICRGPLAPRGTVLPGLPSAAERRLASTEHANETAARRAWRRVRLGIREGLLFVARGVIGLVVVSAAAILATAPICAWYFGQVAPAGLLANVVVVPLAELWVLPVGLAGCAVAPLLTGASSSLLQLSGAGAAAMAAVIRAIASVAPDGTVGAPTLLEAALWYAGLAAVVLATGPHREGRRAWRIAFALLVASGVAFGARRAAPRLFPSLSITFLDVGQGDSSLVRLPDGRTLLVDGGGSFDPDFDPGTQVIVPWLVRQGVRRIDVVVLTHPHPDHANGLAAVVERFPVGEVWTNGVENDLPGLVRLEAAAAARGVPVVRPHRLEGPAPVEVLHPLLDGEVKVRPAWSENDGSIVLRIAYGGRAVLLTGDIERRAEARLTADPDAARHLAADVLKAPHHGSRTSSTPPLVAAVRPQVVVFSVGAGNRWGFPATEVDARWRAIGARTLRTDRDGGVTVRICRDGDIVVEAARARWSWW